MKLSEERLWCLSWWRSLGWSMGRPLSRGIKKWERHIEILTKQGLLEADEYGLHQITDAGRDALEAHQ